MAYDTTLATRIRRLVMSGPEMVEKKMFGGLGFILWPVASTVRIWWPACHR